MNWKELLPSHDGTHHVINNIPAYAERFDEVLKFHDPGLAPVMRDGLAWHILPNGDAAYPHRYLRTFGFYEGLAAVQTKTGWFHIYPDGSNVYSEHYDWCGNFQNERSTVRLNTGNYRHILKDGSAAYPEVWRYVGDYKDGYCVVQNDEGYSTHLNLHGKPVHGKWFTDLDIFHKGFARARDADGWMHVNYAGNPIYARRFAAVEPFYNGQSRIERFDGGLEIIDEYGNPILELRSATRSEFAALSADMVGFWRTQTIAAAVRLGIMELLPDSSTSIAAKAGLSKDGTQRLLRALAELELVTCDDGNWQTTARGVFLCQSHPLTLVDAALEYAGDLGELWSSLPQALTLESGWKRPDIFNDVAQDPKRLSAHHRMLSSYAHHDYAQFPHALGLHGKESVLDAGGGLGTLAGHLLQAYPHLTVTVLDKPDVVAKGQQNSDAQSRCQWLAGDLFKPWGVVVDAVVLARVLHDWDDADAMNILRHAREALPKGGRLFVIEMLLSDNANNNGAGSLCDLHLMMVTGGRERSPSAFEKLFNQTGFRLREIKKTKALPSILCGEAV